MARPHALPTPPREPAWDIAFTRLVQALRPQVETCTGDLARRFQALGVRSEVEVRPTPRGLSTFLALLGQRGLIGLVDLTLVDGMTVGQGPHALLDIRLLDACGDVVAEALAAGHLDRAANVVYVAALAHFELLRPAADLARRG